VPSLSLFLYRSIMFFDTHCHLTDKAFDADRAAVIQRALDAGVTRMLTLATDAASSRAAIELAERFACVYAAVGIHPESVREAKTTDLRLIRELAQRPKVIALGEIGLDFYWDKTTAELQQNFFERQLDLAAELNLPVAIHDRDAHTTIIETLRARRNLNVRGVLHAFSGSIEMAHAAFDLGFVVAFGGPLTFKNNKQAPEMIRALPLEKILLETDSPYLTPHPLRGKRNEPTHVKLVAQRIAALQALSIEQVAAQTTRNALELFRLEEL
jgi:TatD DNase family protein